MATLFIPLSPAERLALYRHVHHPSRKVKDGQAGRRLRRFMRALGLDTIRKALAENDEFLGRYCKDEKSQHWFELTDEVQDELAELESLDRTPDQEMRLGEVFDRIAAERQAVREGHASGLVQPCPINEIDLWAPNDEDFVDGLSRAILRHTEDVQRARQIVGDLLARFSA